MDSQLLSETEHLCIKSFSVEYCSQKTNDTENYPIINEEVNPQIKEEFESLADQMYLPYSNKHRVYLQQDQFLDKHLITVKDLDQSQRPINQYWS